MIYLTVGPSGSGKSTYYKREEHGALVCPDDIRRELTGDVSDQSQNALVWVKAYKRAERLVKKGEDIYFSSTACKMSSIRNIVNELYLSYPGPRCEVTLLVFNDGKDLSLLKKRVKKDLDEKKDRPNTLIEVDGKSVIERQHEQFMSLDLKEVESKLKEEFAYISLFVKEV